MAGVKYQNLSTAQDNALNAAQVMFSMNPAYTPHVTRFWEAQDHFLKETEKYMASWFQRRHEATQAALEAATEAADEDMRNPATAMKTITDWQTHSMERMAEDITELADLMTRCASIWSENETEAVEETAENANRATKGAKSTAV
ncbi:hypothetical protein [Marivita sp. S2033]|uniref:hypothetical protein n=1 Tax=Marivita sp. S2033 TaxID=3373187 RepID=UPI003982B44C